MAFLDGLGRTVEILVNAGSTKDSGGQTVADWQVETTTQGRIDASGGNEKTGMAQGTINNLRAMLPPEITVTGKHRLRCDGVTYDVESVERITGAGGALHHLTLTLKRVG